MSWKAILLLKAIFMSYKRKKQGRDHEELAVSYLIKNGYQIIKRNYTFFHGEIDIVAQEKDFLVFVEVKSRNSIRYGQAIESLTQKQQKKICQTALGFIKNHQITDPNVRFDVVAIQNDWKQGMSIQLIKNAFPFRLE